MDRLLYVSMSGAKETLRAQTANNHNLANASTTGFRADLSAFQSRAVTGTGYASRVYATNSTVGWDSKYGSQQATGRDLDVAIKGDGWLAVQAPDGHEAYTRAGDLQIQPDGMLTTATGHPVIGNGGPITVPQNTSLLVGSDGTISIVPLGQGAETMASVGRLKLVNPASDSMERGADGLFRVKDGTDAEADANVQVSSGVLEQSNVNVAESMVNMIELSRHFDLQVKAMKTAEDDGAASAQLLRST
jgi:flagellar basal-body rod protein FlgF